MRYSWKLGNASLHRYPVGKIICRNPTSKFLFHEENGFKKYSYILQYLELFYMCTLWAYIYNFVFCEKFKNWIWPPFLGRRKFFWKLERVVCLNTLWVEKFWRNCSISQKITIYASTVQLCVFCFIKLSMSRGATSKSYHQKMKSIPL